MFTYDMADECVCPLAFCSYNQTQDLLHNSNPNI